MYLVPLNATELLNDGSMALSVEYRRRRVVQQQALHSIEPESYTGLPAQQQAPHVTVWGRNALAVLLNSCACHQLATHTGVHRTVPPILPNNAPQHLLYMCV